MLSPLSVPLTGTGRQLRQRAVLTRCPCLSLKFEISDGKLGADGEVAKAKAKAGAGILYDDKNKNVFGVFEYLKNCVRCMCTCVSEAALGLRLIGLTRCFLFACLSRSICLSHLWCVRTLPTHSRPLARIGIHSGLLTIFFYSDPSDDVFFFFLFWWFDAKVSPKTTQSTRLRLLQQTTVVGHKL